MVQESVEADRNEQEEEWDTDEPEGDDELTDSGEEDDGEDEDEDEEDEEDDDDEEEYDEDDEEEDDDEEEEDEDDDDGEGEEEFADEPGEKSTLVPISPGDEEVPEDEYGQHDEEPRHSADDDNKRILAMVVCCCCCCILIALGVALPLLLKKDDSDASASPSAAPSQPPSLSRAPSPSPSFHPSEILYPVVADTYMKDGVEIDLKFGAEDEFLVMSNPGITEAFGLLEFDLGGLPPDAEGGRFGEAILRLTHVDSAAEYSVSDVTVVKLQHDPDISIEELTFRGFTVPAENEVGPTFQVATNDTTIEVDITSLVRGNSKLRGRRQLQAGTMFLQLVSQGTNLNGVEFRTREYENGAFEPTIVHKFSTHAPTQAPTKSPAPSVSHQPSPSPTISAAPSVSRPPSLSPTIATPAPSLSAEPTASAHPTLNPTVSPQPSLSGMPSHNPTATVQPSNPPSVSHSPSLSASPTVSPTFSPAPSITSQPSLSNKPSTCQEQLEIVTFETRGATANPLPEGAFEYLEQAGDSVTVRIHQVWTTEDLAWIAPWYAISQTQNSCVKTHNVTAGATLDITADCLGTNPFATIAFIVNDESLISGNDLTLPDGCVNDPLEDIAGKKVLYAVYAKCTEPPPGCS